MMVGQPNKQSIEVAKKIPKNSRIAELGVWKGYTSRHLLDTDPTMLYLVDAWSVEPYQYENNEHRTFEEYIARYSKMVGSSDPEKFQEFYDTVYFDVLEHFYSFNNVQVHRRTTNDFFRWFELFEEERLDFVYLDASHEYKQVLFDLEESFNVLLKPKTGILFGDDYNNKPGVKKAVDEFRKKYKNEIKSFNNFYKNQYLIKLK